jgi:Tfp pilus tip-associated adhesin PilY1
MISVPALAAALLCFAAARAATTYNNTVSAVRTASADGATSVTLLLEVAGDLPGMGKVTLRRQGNNVVGGTWSLTVLPADADASSSEKGRLNGTVTGGSITLDPDDTVVSVSSLQLTVHDGTGQHASVGSGSGTLGLSPDIENPPKLKGTLSLNF